jgi:ABC-2 type transport system permease protein
MNKIFVQALKEWREFRRDRLTLALAFLLPIFSLLLFGYGIRLESKNIPLAVQDFDETSLSREYMARLYATNIIVPAVWKQFASPQAAIDRGVAKVAIIIPKGFEAHVLARETAPLQVLIDGSDISSAQIVLNTVKIANSYFEKMLSPTARISLPVVPHLRIWFNPGRKESLFIVPGVLGVILWMYPALLAAVAASREKEHGTIVRVYSAGMSPVHLLLGKAVIYAVVGICLAIFICLINWLLFGVTPAGDITPIVVAIPIYVFTSVLFGLMLGTFASSQTVAVQATSTAGFFPCLLLSGFVYPISNIPFPLNLFSMIVPARYFIELSRDVFVRGAGWFAVWHDPLILMLFNIVFFAIGCSCLGRMQVKE